MVALPPAPAVEAVAYQLERGDVALHM